MEITASLVKDLRERTGVGMMECKKALVHTDGDIEKAIDYLRETGVAKAAKKAGRIASEGIVECYVHGGGRIGVMIEVNCETDFAAQNPEFKEFAKDLAMQIAANRPEYVKREDVPAAVVEHEKDIVRQQAINEGKNPNFLDKIIEGRLKKFYEDAVLMEQSFIKDENLTVQDKLTQLIQKIGENISVRRFVRYERGEGLEKKVDNFVEEVMNQIK
ncbi:MAG: translation elongation factor Ts [Clostridia bacterium]|nr:translation elongation factor Ts [Clostridia bacterium]